MYPQNIYYSVMNRIVLPQWSYFTARKSSNQGSPMSQSKIRHTYFTFQTARSYVRFLRSMGLTSNWHSTEVIFRFSSSLTQRLHSWCSMVAKRLHCKTESPQFKSHFWLKKKILSERWPSWKYLQMKVVVPTLHGCWKHKGQDKLSALHIQKALYK